MNLTKLRKERGVTQIELANRLGTKQSNISRVEKGRIDPSFSFVVKYLNALNYHIEVVGDDE